MSPIEMQECGGTFVTLGNAYQQFGRFWEILERSLHVLPQPIHIQYGESPPPIMVGQYNSFDYCTRNQFNNFIRTSAIIIGHAGAGTLIQANAAGHRPIIICRQSQYGEHIDDHQTEFALRAQREGLAWVCGSEGELIEILKIIFEKPLRKKLIMPAIPLFGPDQRVLIVAAVGGHLTEALRITEANRVTDFEILTDARRPSDPGARIKYFPPCTHRILFPLRILQAFCVLIKTPSHKNIFSTGTSIGSAFGIAAMFAGRRFVALETITRINSPSLWFRVSTLFKGEFYAYSWSEWSKKPRWWRRINVVNVDIQDI